MCSMRWDNLKVEAEESRTLPGYREPATVRTFDAPEALDTRFYEVRSKSALNKVPKQSRMPFRWTINPYRGCAHACAFCAGGDTEILMADGRTKPLAEIRPGDRIYGTVQVGQYRRYAATTVLDHWSTIKRAYRVVLEDGTEIVCKRRPSLLDRPGQVEARHGCGVRPPSAPPPDAERQADGRGSLRRPPGPQRRVPGGIPMRDDSRRRPSSQPGVRPAKREALDAPPLSTRAGGHRRHCGAHAPTSMRSRWRHRSSCSPRRPGNTRR